MGSIFGAFAYLMGYILGFFLDITNNYGVSIILFTIVINLITLPFAIKRQKSMLVTTRLAKKQNEIKKKYANDKKKLEEETMKLYQGEGANPMGGCVTMFLPLILFFAVIGTVYSPLKNTLHLPADKVKQATSLLSTIPGIENNTNSRYDEIEIVKLFPDVKQQLTMFNEQELQDIEEFHEGFNFVGLDLLATPKNSPFSSMLWLIPVLCFVFSALSSYFMQKMQDSISPQPGCMKYSMYPVFLLTAWFAYTVPAAAGLYWIINGLCQSAQNLLINYFCGPKVLTAKAEYARIALREQQESNIIRLKQPKIIESKNDGNVKKKKN